MNTQFEIEVLLIQYGDAEKTPTAQPNGAVNEVLLLVETPKDVTPTNVAEALKGEVAQEGWITQMALATAAKPITKVAIGEGADEMVTHAFFYTEGRVIHYDGDGGIVAVHKTSDNMLAVNVQFGANVVITGFTEITTFNANQQVDDFDQLAMATPSQLGTPQPTASSPGVAG